MMIDHFQPRYITMGYRDSKRGQTCVVVVFLRGHIQTDTQMRFCCGVHDHTRSGKRFSRSNVCNNADDDGRRATDHVTIYLSMITQHTAGNVRIIKLIADRSHTHTHAGLFYIYSWRRISHGKVTRDNLPEKTHTRTCYTIYLLAHTRSPHRVCSSWGTTKKQFIFNIITMNRRTLNPPQDPLLSYMMLKSMFSRLMMMMMINKLFRFRALLLFLSNSFSRLSNKTESTIIENAQNK